MKKVFNLVKAKKRGAQSSPKLASSMPNLPSDADRGLTSVPNAASRSPSNTSEQRRTLPRRKSSVASAASSVLSKARRRSSASEGGTKLHLAVINEELDKVKKIVAKNDVNIVNATDGKGRTPLHLASEKGLVSLVWPLLSHGAVVQARDGHGATPLHKYSV